MKTILQFFIGFSIFISQYQSAAQSIERSVIGSLGFSFSGAQFQADCTVGEVAIYTLGSPEITLSQGFHQPPQNSAFCLGDFDTNGFVNVADLLIFASALGCTISCGLPDLDESGAVNIADLLIFISVFGNECG